MIYLICEVDYDCCTHEATVDGPAMSPGEAKKVFSDLLAQFKQEHEAASSAFTDAFGWSDEPRGIPPDDYHERMRSELRKAGCWTFLEFLVARGYREVEHAEIKVLRRYQADEFDEHVDKTD